jgi:hypothetical protein
MAEHDELTEENFFSTDDVYKIAALVNENLAGVVYHYWINNANSPAFEVLDYITLAFKSGNSITLTAGLETDGIRVDEPDFAAERAKLEADFEGKVTIESRDVSQHKFWKSAIGQDITPSLMRFESRVINDSLVLKFEDADAVEIFLGIEGLEVDFFDEDEDSGMTDVQA